MPERGGPRRPAFCVPVAPYISAFCVPVSPYQIPTLPNAEMGLMPKLGLRVSVFGCMGGGLGLRLQGVGLRGFGLWCAVLGSGFQ